MLKNFRYFLLPLSLGYGLIIWLRNWMYDKNILKSSSFNFPIICVGNIAVGGTGKTPMTEYLIRILKSNYKVATLSRGYKRKTRGFAIANETTTALEIGDEPMQFHQKFPDITVAVGEERLVSIPELLQFSPDTQIIILDDAFQHRAIRAGLNLVLTEYKNLYTRDLMLPAGDLRDVKQSVKRANVIIVTKCKPNLGLEEKKALIQEIDPTSEQTLFFTEIIYTKPTHLFNKKETTINPDTDVLLICGIANPRPLKEFLTSRVHTYDMLRYPDHHIFNMDDLKEIREHFHQIKSANKLILTTEKDGVRMKKFEQELADYPIYVLPIEHSFLFDDAERFRQLVMKFKESFKKEK